MYNNTNYYSVMKKKYMILSIKHLNIVNSSFSYMI